MNRTMKMAHAYFSISQSMKSNTDEIIRVLEAEGPESPKFQRLWVERDSAFLSWSNAAAALRELPLEEVLMVHQQVEKMRAQIG
ncbi:hypothetical protein [Paenibacillus sp. VMFN-D1]|uniref:hypothetical protein n=1 Tax=Paenibacillus sp. VMFN-D1 TaxID=2135608 RepID=UPI000E22BB7E|nr:hypothetical protein [Paenibacillus sp. VMFN-D1]RED34704.1 hypothetical protein C7820_4367 [Paenibacillus sp. VMFN-D1]